MVAIHADAHVELVAPTAPVQLQPVPVEVGLYNHRYIEIRSGIEAGARVALAPPAGSSTAGSFAAPQSQPKEVSPVTETADKVKKGGAKESVRAKVASLKEPA